LPSRNLSPFFFNIFHINYIPSKNFIPKMHLHPKMHLPESILYERPCVLTGFAILYMLVTVPHLLPWNTKGTLVGVLSWCHLIGAVSPWIGSFLYHLFMNVNYDEVLYRTLLKVDMIGIWLCQSFGVWNQPFEMCWRDIWLEFTICNIFFFTTTLFKWFSSGPYKLLY